jgi:hypothetical protein
MKPLVGRLPDQRRDEVAPAGPNVAPVVTPLPAPEVGNTYTVVTIQSKKWKISHKFSFQIEAFTYKIEAIRHAQPAGAEAVSRRKCRIVDQG